MDYPKIQTLFKRNVFTNKIIETEFVYPEFEYLRNNEWIWTEKVDGTNIRISYTPDTRITFGGRTANAQIPAPLIERLTDLFIRKPQNAFVVDTEVHLYGEGYGAKIQKGGGRYKPDGVDFILFDVLIGKWWLRRDDVADIASKLGIETVPIIGRGTIDQAIKFVRDGFQSPKWHVYSEGLVLRPPVELFTRNGDRIITKLKTRDFK